MEIETNLIKILDNKTVAIDENNTTLMSSNVADEDSRALSILVIQITIASVGIVSNLTVIVVFLNHKKFRRKIPNIFIINQVRKTHIYSVSSRIIKVFIILKFL